MARFYGCISGQAQNEASRIGNKSSGLQAHIRGWDMGIRIVCDVDDKDHDIIRVYRTGGSNYNDNIEEIITIIDKHSEYVKHGKVKPVKPPIPEMRFSNNIFKGLIK